MVLFSISLFTHCSGAKLIILSFVSVFRAEWQCINIVGGIAPWGKIPVQMVISIVDNSSVWYFSGLISEFFWAFMNLHCLTNKLLCQLIFFYLFLSDVFFLGLAWFSGEPGSREYSSHASSRDHARHDGKKRLGLHFTTRALLDGRGKLPV